MMASNFLTLTFAGLVIVGYVCALSSKKEWAPEELFNPQKNAMQCGFLNSKPAYICDPNGFLGDHLSPVNWILENAAHNGTRCPCSAYACEHAEKGLKGYKIFVALVKRMKFSSTDDKLESPEEYAQQFAKHLGSSKWKTGKCEENIVIFYSVDDRKLAFYTGSVAGSRLTKEYLQLLEIKIKSRLNADHFAEALNVLIYDIKTILNCDAPWSYYCPLYELEPSSANTGTTSILITSLTALLVSLLFQ